MNTEHCTNIGRKRFRPRNISSLHSRVCLIVQFTYQLLLHFSKRGHLTLNYLIYIVLGKLHVSFYRFPLYKNRQPAYMASWHKQEDKYKRWLEMATAFFDAYQCSSFSHKISIMQSGVFWPDSKISTEEHSRRC